MLPFRFCDAISSVNLKSDSGSEQRFPFRLLLDDVDKVDGRGYEVMNQTKTKYSELKDQGCTNQGDRHGIA